MLVIDPTKEPRITRVLNSDLSRERKISKLQLMALRAFPSSPIQNAIVAAYRTLQETA